MPQSGFITADAGYFLAALIVVAAPYSHADQYGAREEMDQPHASQAGRGPGNDFPGFGTQCLG